jgi:hypothetical protein
MAARSSPAISTPARETRCNNAITVRRQKVGEDSPNSVKTFSWLFPVYTTSRLA